MDLNPFYPIQSFKPGSYKESLHKKMMEILEKEGCEKAAICPEGESIDQWVAIHMVFFFNDVNIYYGSIQEKCTNYSCPTMAAGAKFEYLLIDKYKHKSPCRVPAKTYIDNLFNWTVHLLEDETIFPPDKYSTFSPNCVSRVRSIAKRFFRVYAHIYYSHLETLQQLHIDKMFYDSLTYYLIFVDLYSLVPSSDLRPLTSLIVKLVPNLRISQQLKETEEEMKPVDDEEIDENGNEPVAATAPATTATATTTAEQKEEDPEKIDWDELLRTAPKEEGATDGEENCECNVL